nr:hypothetical protein [Tanacetum cinerariifolium]
MTAFVIPISSNSSEQSVGSHVSRVILFGAIPAIILVIHVVHAEVPIVPTDPIVAPKVGAISVTSPTGRHKSLTVHDAMVLRWKDMVASRPFSSSRSSSHDTLEPSSKFPLALIVSPREIRRRPSILVRHGEATHFDRPYRTYPNGPCKLLTTRKRDRRDLHGDVYLIVYRISHSGPSTRVASPRLVYPSVMTLQYSEAFRRWRSAPLSFPYLLMTLESSLDSSSKRSLDSSPPSPEPSRKRSRSPTTLVPSSILVSRSIVPTHADLLPPRKRLRNSYSPEDSIEEHMEIGTTDAKAVVNLGIRDEVGVDTEDGIGIGVKIAASDIREDEEEFETAQRQLEAAQLMASGERVGLTNRIRRLGRENLMVRALLYIRRDQVDSLHHHMALLQEEFHQIRSDRNDARRRLTRLESFVERREEDRIEKYVGGLPDNIRGNVMSVEPTILQDAIRLENSLTDQKLKGYAIRSAENKGKFKSNQRDCGKLEGGGVE